jgi:hypothetical protein
VRRFSLPPEVAGLSRLLRDLTAPWAVAGGWAIDLALGRVTRAHADVDVALLREDQAALRAALPGWEFRAAVDGAPVPWAVGVRLEAPVHEVHARPAAGAEDAIEFLLNERDGADWVYRRDPAVRRPLTRVFREARGGMRALAPEVVLLYKSKAPRAADEHDFRAALPLLDVEARRWLAAALRRADARHPWAAILAPEA